MSQFRFRVGGEEWTAIDKWSYYRYVKHGGHELEDIMYEDEMIAKYGANFADNTF